MNAPALISALGLGLAGAGHCLGMCGPIAAALNLGSQRRLSLTLAYHAGRILSYTALGGGLGFIAGSVDVVAWTLVLRYLAGMLLIGMGLSIGGWWQGMLALEKAGARLWRPVQRLSSRLLPLRHSRQALALGLCWGLMPCGLIYSSRAWAATAGDALASAGLMFCFGLGTLPAMLATSLGADKLRVFLRRRGLKVFIALALVISGLWTLYLVSAHAAHLRWPGAAGETPLHQQHHSAK